MFSTLRRLLTPSPAQPAATPSPTRARASLGGSAPQVFPYDAAAWHSQEMGDWLPWIRSPDSEINVFRDRMVARTRDLARNDGWVAGAVDGILDSTIGGEYRLSAKPDHRALRSVHRAFDAEWADEFGREVEALWRSYANDIRHYNDVARRQTVSQQFRLALRHHLVDGEGLMASYWLPERVGRRSARYATAFVVIDPDRLSNPYQQVDTRHMRGGVEIDDDGVALAYHIRRAHQNDWYNAIESMEWERVAREDPDGWQRVFHAFDYDRAGQNRGVSVFAPVIARLKMLARYYDVELQAAAINAVFGTYITSPFDRQMIEEALDDGARELSAYQRIRSDFHAERSIMLGGARVPTLVPGEDIKTVAAERPLGEFSSFTHEMLRGVAAVLGTSAEQVTKDYSEASWSSARAGIVEAEKTYERRCSNFASDIATPIYANWMREPLENGDLPLPRGVTSDDMLGHMTALARSKWLGAARGWVDPVAERQGEILGLDASFDTLERVCARQGMDWEENVEQRARERRRFEELGLPAPEWAGPNTPAGQAAQPPEAK